MKNTDKHESLELEQYLDDGDVAGCVRGDGPRAIAPPDDGPVGIRLLSDP